jgi:hypothetical protein
MSIGLLFWVIMLIWLLLYGFTWYNPDPRLTHAPHIVLWLLLALLGWATFGPMIRG